MALNFKKLTATIHYICDEAEKVGFDLDSIKLNKGLWYSDAYAYVALGHSITGETYVRRKHGPAAKHQLVALKALQDEGRVVPGKKTRRGKWSRCFDSVGDVDKSKFSGTELQIIDGVMKKLSDQDSFELSEKTHGAIWRCIENGEEIPLYTIFAESLGTITEDHMKMASADLCQP